MTWLTLPALLLTMVGAQEVQQSPLYAAAPEGASVSLVCLTRGALFGGVFLERRWPAPANVVYFEDQVEPTVDRAFRGRIAFSGTQSNLTISMSLLTPNDSGLYACRAASQRHARGPGTMVAVTERPTPGACACQDAGPSVALRVAAASTGALLLLLLGLGWAWVLRWRRRRAQVKRLSGDQSSRCVVYEDMAYRGSNQQRR
ncbi:T-cell antigen CD7 [Dipodomys merriami]|uniref:T-cell antigen CD7 n=1 Tax=Dipodomys merriami TaxID=94247 RepID=UPI003856038A